MFQVVTSLNQKLYLHKLYISKIDLAELKMLLNVAHSYKKRVNSVNEQKKERKITFLCSNKTLF